MLLPKMMFKRIFVFESCVTNITGSSLLVAMLSFHVPINAAIMDPVWTLGAFDHFRIQRFHQNWKKKWKIKCFYFS